MEAVATLRPFRCTIGAIPNALSSPKKPSMIPIYHAPSNKPLCLPWLKNGGRLISRPVGRKGSCLTHLMASETALAMTSDEVSSSSSSQRPLEKKNLHATTFPKGFESLVLEVCDGTGVAELKVKVGEFEMQLKRNIGGTEAPRPTVIPSTPKVESISAAPPALPQKSSPVVTNPFMNVSLAKSSKLASLEGSGTNAYLIVSSSTVGSFRRGRTVKGKKQPPICKEGDIIKEGQVIGYLDQFGSELPVKSDIAGEVLKLLFNDGEAVGYGDPLVAVLPSFHGIR